MLTLLRLVSLRHLLRHPLRSTLTILGVAIGVATMVGVSAINRSVMDAFRSTIDTVSGRADLSIGATERGIDDEVVDAVKKVAGVAHASGSLSIVAPVNGAPGVNLLVMGINATDDGYFRTYEGKGQNVGQLSDDLEFLNSTDRMLISERFANDHNLQVGDTFELITAEGAKPFIVHGLLKETGPIKAFGGAVGVMDLFSAQAAFARGHVVDRIDVAATSPDQVEAVKANLEKALGPTYDVDRPERRGASVETMVRSFQMGLNLGSGVALLVGVFLVYNTVSIGVLQRRREIGTLRALGSTKRRIRALFTLEALVIGVLGTVLGYPIGVGLARAAVERVSSSVSQIYIQVNVADIHLSPRDMLMGALLGLGGSMFAALRPAFAASSIQPVEALRKDFAMGGSGQLASWPTITGAALLLLAWPATLIPAPQENFPFGGYLAMFFTLMGTTLLTPLLLRNLQRPFQGPTEATFGIAGRIAADNFSRTPVRTAVPVSALAIGVAMTICIGGFVGSFQRSSQRWIDQSVPADLFVTASAKIAGVQNTPMKPDLIEDLRGIPGVQEVDMIRMFSNDVLGLRVFVLSLDPEIYQRHGHTELREGALPNAAKRAEGWVTISENLSRRRNLHVGSTFEMPSPTGVHSYKVAAVITDYTSDQGTVFMERRIFIDQFKDDLVDSFELYLDDIRDLERIRTTITERHASKFGLYVLSNAELRAEAHRMVDDAFAITYAMELVAVVLALLGVINTLLAAVLDRTREIGLLRAVGADRGHIIRLFVGEAALMGLTGGFIGMVAGYILGFTVTTVVGVGSTGWSFPFHFPWLTAVQMFVLAAVCAVLAGLYPARRAARLDVVEALSYE